MTAHAWAYEFETALSPTELQSRLNAAGPWSWTAHESEWYGDYLICRPVEGARVRIHDRHEPFFGSSEREPGPRYKCQLELTTGRAELRSQLDSAFTAMIAALEPTEFGKIDTYD